tara:strand:- start:81 stop:623 length:543 start_codon:yes stop_codon:yes gene_type:complete
MADLNKLRQVNPHWKPSESFIKDQEEAKQKAEKDHLNKVHNKLWGEDYHQEDLDKASAEGSKKFWPEEMKNKADKYDGDINKDTKWDVESHVKYNKEMNPSRYTKNDIAQTKRAIIDKILKHFDDELFEMVSEEMGKYYVFKSDNYLTEAGYDMFEDEWFEFYHEHHGDILFQVKTEINM